MEQKIMDMLFEMNKRFDAMDQKIDDFKLEMKNELNELEERLEKRLEKKMEEKLEQKLEHKLNEIISSYMFVFEAEYGRKINIMFEELTAKNQKERIAEENMLVLEKRIDKNSTFVFNHEKRITTLEKAKK